MTGLLGTILSTPRPMPGRLLPAAAGAFVLVLALPLFLVFGWSLGGWALAIVLWLLVHGLDLLLARARTRSATRLNAGLQVFALFFKSIALLVALFAAVAADPHLALAGAVTYALAYTAELGLSLATYFGSER